MKHRIPVHVLIEIERLIEVEKDTGILSYTSLSKLMHDNAVNCDVLARAIDLARVMPKNDIDAAIQEYDTFKPKMDELKFVKALVDKYGVERGDVILRIQYVRRINKELPQRRSCVNWAVFGNQKEDNV
jgi:hypothetical protein